MLQNSIKNPMYPQPCFFPPPLVPVHVQKIKSWLVLLDNLDSDCIHRLSFGIQSYTFSRNIYVLLSKLISRFILNLSSAFLGNAPKRQVKGVWVFFFFLPIHLPGWCEIAQLYIYMGTRNTTTNICPYQPHHFPLLQCRHLCHHPSVYELYRELPGCIYLPP